MHNYGAVEGRQNSALSACCLDFHQQLAKCSKHFKALPSGESNCFVGGETKPKWTVSFRFVSCIVVNTPFWIVFVCIVVNRSEWWINCLELLSRQMWISFETTNPRKALHDVFDSYGTHDQAILYPRSVTVSDTICSVLKDKDSGSASFGTRMRFESKKFKVLTQH